MSIQHDLLPSCSVFVDSPAPRLTGGPGYVNFDRSNVVVRISGKGYRSERHRVPLSVHFVNRGLNTYVVDGRRVVIDEGHYLIQNLDQYSENELSSDIESEGMVVGFLPGFAEQALHAMVTPSDKLLDQPISQRKQSVQFFDRLFKHDDIVSPALFRIRDGVASGNVTHGWLEEQHFDLLERLLIAHRGVAREIDTLPAMRASTRSEYYLRLGRARDYMEAYLGEPITLRDVAAESCLAPSHFLRLFDSVFGETPHQYLTRRRIERAQQLLLQTDTSVTEICMTVGFQSLGSFSWLFKNRTGLSPQQYRENS